MSNYKIVFFLIATLSIFFSCQNNEDINDTEIDDCVFVQNDDNQDGLIDEIENAILLECRAGSLTSKIDVENNLIGEWKLVGHGEGWISTPSEPCGYLIISDEELMFKFQNESTDTVTIHSWNIEEINWPGGKYYLLNTMPENVEGLFINVFCDSYMFGDATPSDGNMYLYEKVK